MRERSRERDGEDRLRREEERALRKQVSVYLFATYTLAPIIYFVELTLYFLIYLQIIH